MKPGLRLKSCKGAPVRQSRVVFQQYLRDRVAEVLRRGVRRRGVLLQELRGGTRTQHDHQTRRRGIQTAVSAACWPETLSGIRRIKVMGVYMITVLQLPVAVIFF